MVERTKQVELFLFINPISHDSLKVEEEAFKFIDTYENNSQITIYPYHNTHTLYSYMIKNQLSFENATLWNNLHNDSYHLSLAFIAASIQGKKKGRRFLMDLQRKMMNQNELLSKDLVIDSAKKADLDVEMFLVDFHSTYIGSNPFGGTNGTLAQRLEQLPHKELVGGSNPLGPTIVSVV